MSDLVTTIVSMKPAALLNRIRGGNVQNVVFVDFISLMKALGFTERRSRSSHHLFAHPEVTELMNVQKVKGQVKPYQVRQLLKLIDEYNLSIEDSS